MCVCEGGLGWWCWCLTIIIISMFSCVLGLIRSVSLQKNESFSGSRSQPGSESPRQYAANVRLLSPQLIRRESSFDLSWLFLVVVAGGGSGPVPSTACVGRWHGTVTTEQWRDEGAQR